MKRIMLMVLLLVVLVAPTAGLAASEQLKLVKCDPDRIACVGTDASEQFTNIPTDCPIIRSKGGNDEILIPKSQGWCFTTIKSEEGNDRIVGKEGGLDVNAGNGDDYIRGGDRGDIINPSTGRDVISTGDGNDTIKARDGEKDRITCGSGNIDDAIADDIDAVAQECEYNNWVHR